MRENKERMEFHETLAKIQRRINGDRNKQQKGPMGNAFATPNPKIPREAFAPKGVDSFVMKMNKDVKYSLLDCPGKFTVRVATFRGNVVIDQERVAEIEQGSQGMSSRLEEAADNAHQLTVALRKKGTPHSPENRPPPIPKEEKTDALGIRLADPAAETRISFDGF